MTAAVFPTKVGSKLFTLSLGRSKGTTLNFSLDFILLQEGTQFRKKGQLDKHDLSLEKKEQQKKMHENLESHYHRLRSYLGYMFFQKVRALR